MKKKPVIGITASYVKHNHYMEGVYVHQDYHHAILASGGLPLVIPIGETENVGSYVSMCDGIILSGGEDVDPQFYFDDPHQKLGFVLPKRDEVELAFVKEVIRQNKPLFGICRGMQLLNVALGGTLVQDIPSEKPSSMQHVQTIPRQNSFHAVDVLEGSYLHQVFQTTCLRVNSLHHQAISGLAPDLEVVSVARDGIVEAVEHKRLPYVFAVQWHPESMYQTSPEMQWLFQDFLAECEKRKHT